MTIFTRGRCVCLSINSNNNNNKNRAIDLIVFFLSRKNSLEKKENKNFKLHKSKFWLRRNGNIITNIIKMEETKKSNSKSVRMHNFSFQQSHINFLKLISMQSSRNKTIIKKSFVYFFIVISKYLTVVVVVVVVHNEK